MEVISNPNPPTARYAGFWLRFVAFIIDWFALSLAGAIIAVPIILAILALGVGMSGIESPWEFLEQGKMMMVGGIIGLIILMIMFSIVLHWLYYALMESSRFGGTLGKMALGLRVVDLEGNRISFGRASGRYFSRIITNMTMLIGYIIAGLTERKQALHDLIAGCLVIRG
jgi:uncharacterized RDD family membrane protein YckC